MTERKLASIQKILDIQPIEGADAIEVATVLGWKVVVKKGDFHIDDLVIYCEIDSFIPHEIAPFLSKGKEPREYNGVKGERLRSVKLRGQISQGLILPIPTGENTDGLLAFNIGMNIIKEGEDVSSILNIQKYEAPIPVCLAGVVRGNFPSFVPKTDQERIQNLTKVFDSYRTKNFEISEKLDGSSCTIYFNNGDFGVCSRNLDLQFDEDNTFWKVCLKYDLENKLRQLGSNIALQGELVGEGIQGNKYKLAGHHFYLFDVYDIDQGKYYSSDSRKTLAEELDINHVPIISQNFNIGQLNIVDILELAEGKSALNPSTEREGIVFKCVTDTDISFKAISNKFLLKNED